MNEKDQTVVDLRDAPMGVDIESLSQHDVVLAALANYYERSGHQVDQLWVGDLGDGTSAMFDLHIGDLNRLVDVETIDTLVSVDPHRYEPWRLAGFEVCVVVPTRKFQHVERRLAGLVDHMTPWTADDSRIVFEEHVDA